LPEKLSAICLVSITPVQHRSLAIETPTKNFQKCFVIDRIESYAEIEQFEDRDFAGIDVAHELIVDCCDCILGREVGSRGRG